MTRFDVKSIFQHFFSHVYTLYYIFIIFIFIRTLNNNCKLYKIQYSRRLKSNNANKKDLISNNENEIFFAIRLISNNKNKKRLISNNENKIFDKNLFLYSIFFYIFIIYFLYKRDLKNTRFNVHNI